MNDEDRIYKRAKDIKERFNSIERSLVELHGKEKAVVAANVADIMLFVNISLHLVRMLLPPGEAGRLVSMELRLAGMSVANSIVERSGQDPVEISRLANCFKELIRSVMET